jgi:hypothetical protein
MRNIARNILGALLITGLATQAAAASEQPGKNSRRVLAGTGEQFRAATGEQFRNANDSIALQARGWCSQEPGNPYNKETDYRGWSAWRASGAWDSRNDCQ